MNYKDISLKITDEVQNIGDFLRDADYTETGISRALKLSELPTTRERIYALSLYLEHLSKPTPLNILIRLFFLHQPVSMEEAERALIAPVSLRAFEQTDLIDISRDFVTANVELIPYQNLLVAADWPENDFPDQVMALASSSRVLMQMTVRRNIKLSLDLGTGCGIQAFMASNHSRAVFAIDGNTRAVRFAQFNAALNRISNINFLAGDLFEPVVGKKFDLVICNPPFVISPQHTYVHTNNEKPIDDFCKSIIQAAPSYLNKGGFLQIVFNWAQIKGEDWKQRIAGWLKPLGCDALLLYSHIEDSAVYAFERINELIKETEQIAGTFKKWMDFYEQERIEGIGFGILTLRRNAAGKASWFRCEKLQGVNGPCGEYIERIFILCDFLNKNINDNSLLKARLLPAPKVRLRQQVQNFPEGWTKNQYRAQLTEGIIKFADVNSDLIDFITKCDGKMRIIDYLKDLSDKSKPNTPDFLNSIRELLNIGILVPGDLRNFPN